MKHSLPLFLPPCVLRLKGAKGVVKLLPLSGAAIRGKRAKRREFSRPSLPAVAQQQHRGRGRQQQGIRLLTYMEQQNLLRIFKNKF